MSPQAPSLSPQADESRTIPRLENGDRLTRWEFERRYDAMPELKKAELIEGVVYVPSPVSFRRHGKPTCHMITWLGHFEAATKGVEAGDNTSLRLDLDNEPQPDAFLRIDPDYGGQSSTEDGFVEGAPELVAEVAASSVSYDLHQKLQVYRRNGVLEYVVWRVDDGVIDWFRLTGGVYQKIDPDASGLYRSQVFPGLWLDSKAMVLGELAKVLSILDEGIHVEEHATFVMRLEKARAMHGS